MGSSTIELVNEQNGLTLGASSPIPLIDPLSKSHTDFLQKQPNAPSQTLAQKIIQALPSEQPLTLESLASDIGSHTYDLISATDQEKSGACLETAQRTAKHLAVLGLVNLSSVPLQHALPIAKGLPIETIGEVYQATVAVAKADQKERTSVALKEASSIALGFATFALATQCAHVVVPALVVKTLAAKLFINYVSGMAARGVVEKGGHLYETVKH